jgi:hypothetical protein
MSRHTEDKHATREYFFFGGRQVSSNVLFLKGLSHEIFGPVFLPVWMYLGLNVNRLWFLNFNDALLILDN